MSFEKTIKAFISLCICAFVAAGCNSKNDGPDTPDPVKHFEITVSDVGTMSCVLNISRDDQTRPYYWTVVKRSQFDYLADNFQDCAVAYLKGNYDFLINDYGETEEEALAELVNWENLENKSIDYLYGSTDYVVIVGYVTEKAESDGDFEYYDFTTASPTRSSNTFEVSLDDCGARSATYTVTPSNSDEYAIAFVPNKTIESYTDDDDLVEYLYNTLGWIDVYQNEWTETKSLKSDTEYALLVFGVKDYAATTAVTKVIFTTDPAGDPTKLTFDYTITDGSVQGFEINVAVTPSDNTLDYFCELVNSDCTAEQFVKYMEETITKFADYGFDRESYFQMFSSYGVDESTYTIYPGETGKIAVLPIKNGELEFACDPIFSDVFTFDEAKTSDATVEVTWDKYYDGAEIAKINPEYGYFGENAVFPVTVNCTGSNYYYNIYVEDGKTYSREDLIYTILSGSNSSYPGDCWAPFGRDGVIYGFAIDENGVCGPIFKKNFNFSKDGASPAQEYIDSHSYEYYSVQSSKKPSAQAKFKALFFDGNGPELMNK